MPNRSTTSALAFLLEHLPPQMHLVIATREDPHLPLARLRVRGQLTELRAADCVLRPPKPPSFSTARWAWASRGRHRRTGSPHRRLDCRPAIGRNFDAGPSGHGQLHRVFHRHASFHDGLSAGRGAAAADGRSPGVPAGHVDSRSPVRAVVRGGDGESANKRSSESANSPFALRHSHIRTPSWNTSNARTCSSSRWITIGSGTAITGCLRICCASGCSNRLRTWRTITCVPATGIKPMVIWPKRFSTP